MTTTPKPSGDQERSRLDPEPMPRRDFLGLAAIWSTVGTLLFALIGAIRLPKAAVLPSPSHKFEVTLPDSIGPSEPYVVPDRSVALFRDGQGVYAISMVCTHLGCIVKPTDAGFDCPCHGSKFQKDGEVTGGPAPKGLPWLEVSSSDGATFVVDQGSTVPPGTRAVA